MPRSATWHARFRGIILGVDRDSHEHASGIPPSSLRCSVRCGARSVASLRVQTCDVDHPAALPAYLQAGVRVYDEPIVAEFRAQTIAVAIGEMAKTSRPKNPFAGRWRITWMEQWDQDFVDAEVEGYFKFGPRNLGSFQFGYVQGEIDNRLTNRDGKPCLEFSWEGNDEMDLASGRGWVVKSGDEISGTIFFHQRGESSFRARKSESQ